MSNQYGIPQSIQMQSNIPSHDNMSYQMRHNNLLYNYFIKWIYCRQNDFVDFCNRILRADISDVYSSEEKLNMAYNQFMIYMNTMNRNNSMNPNLRPNSNVIPNPYITMEWQNQMQSSTGTVSPV